jgi:hypothetical protein
VDTVAKPKTSHIPTTTFPPLDGEPRFRWRRILALIRGDHVITGERSLAEVQPNDLVLAFFSGPCPSGWTQVPNNPGVYSRRWAAGDV